MRVVEKNFVTNGIDFIWGLKQFGRDFSDRLDKTAREVYEGTRPSVFKYSVFARKRANNAARCGLIIFFPNIILFQ